ncbi:MAG: phosphoribosylformylglycinamidine synthase I [Planctomycetaceae bacterium]|jgi:phosphoribosylformylglycinamidine synthase|nr:phosphoribosylformylglycinamidine synthase I [Planctomycetaceae bacterium]
MNVLILRAPGTNCDTETAYAFQKAEAKSVEILHINRVLEAPQTLDKFQILCIPGGFSFGDDIASGKIFAAKIGNHLFDNFRRFHEKGNLILGICNGFQVLLKSGLLTGNPLAGSLNATLTWNKKPLYTDRWVHLFAEKTECVFLRDIDTMYLPIAHAEGRFVPKEDELEQMKQRKQLALRYRADSNPNGSVFDVAGACDPTGRIFGLMPHPERHIDALQHPHWTRYFTPKQLKDGIPAGSGLKIFQNAVRFF